MDERVDVLVAMVIAYNLPVSSRAPVTETLGLLSAARAVATGSPH